MHFFFHFSNHVRPCGGGGGSSSILWGLLGLALWPAECGGRGRRKAGGGRRKMWMPKRTARSASVCRLLFLKLKAQNEREKFAFCSVKGCERIKIKALIPKNAGISDCTATAYPKFTEKAIVDVPMPKKLFGSLLVSGRQPAEPQAP